MAGNGNSGTSIPFRMSEADLKKAIDKYRAMYKDGGNGPATWYGFCASIGYSEADVAECYQRGREGNNAYTGRARLLEVFATEIKDLAIRTCPNKQLATALSTQDYLSPKVDGSKPPEVRCTFGCPGYDQWVEAMR